MGGDQRAVAGRPDVLSYASPPLDHAVHVAGAPVAEIFAATSGSDADWVVKVLDIWPASRAPSPMDGYALPVAMDIFRARYRNDAAHPVALTANAVEKYRLVLPMVDHVFPPGHRIRVQIQSSWFPLYDRNSQSFVDDIFLAGPGDYRAATQRIFHGGGRDSLLELPGG